MPEITEDLVENAEAPPDEGPDPEDDGLDEEAPVPGELVLDARLEALIRKIAKEEIGKALGHTIV